MYAMTRLHQLAAGDDDIERHHLGGRIEFRSGRKRIARRNDSVRHPRNITTCPGSLRPSGGQKDTAKHQQRAHDGAGAGYLVNSG